MAIESTSPSSKRKRHASQDSSGSSRSTHDMGGSSKRQKVSKPSSKVVEQQDNTYPTPSPSLTNQSQPLPSETTPAAIESNEAPYTKDDRYFLENGDIVIIVEETAFKVHMQKLADAGGFFADVFSLPQPKTCDPDSMMYDVPFINVQDMVTATEMRYFISYVYGEILPGGSDGRSFPWVHWDCAVSLLRISQRFSIGTVRRAALEALSLLFPYGEVLEGFHPKIKGVMGEENRKKFSFRYPLEAINLFRECQVPAMMPMAYYHAAQLPYKYIIDGAPKKDGGFVCLSQEDKDIVMEGKEALKELRLKKLHGWIYRRACGRSTDQRPSERCHRRPIQDYANCYEFLNRMFTHMQWQGYFNQENALDSISPKGIGMLRQNLCYECMKQVEKDLKEGVQRSYLGIPECFKLSEWYYLRKEQEKEDETWDE